MFLDLRRAFKGMQDGMFFYKSSCERLFKTTLAETESAYLHPKHESKDFISH
jgi:hypothetical protein